VLGSAKRTINIAIIENEKVIVAKRKCKITLEDSRNVHAMLTQQLAMAEK
jgi:hypothetical protein